MGIPRSPRRRPIATGAAQSLPPDTTRLDLDTLRRGGTRRRGGLRVGEREADGTVPVITDDGTTIYMAEDWLPPEEQTPPRTVQLPPVVVPAEGTVGAARAIERAREAGDPEPLRRALEGDDDVGSTGTTMAQLQLLAEEDRRRLGGALDRARSATETAAFDARARAAAAQRAEYERQAAALRARDLARQVDSTLGRVGQQWEEEDAYARAEMARGDMFNEARDAVAAEDAAAAERRLRDASVDPGRARVTVTEYGQDAPVYAIEGTGTAGRPRAVVEPPVTVLETRGHEPTPEQIAASGMSPETAAEHRRMLTQRDVPDVALSQRGVDATAGTPRGTPLDAALGSLGLGIGEFLQDQGLVPRMERSGSGTAAAAEPVIDTLGDAQQPTPEAPPVARRGGARRRPPVAEPPPPVDENQATIDALMQPGVMQQAFPEDYAATGPQDRQRDLIARAGQLAQRRAEVTGGGIAAQRDALAEQEARRRDIETRQRAAVGQARMRYQDAVRRASEMRVDPDHWWADRGIAGSVAAAIAIGMGSFGEAFGGGPNVAAQMIREAIDADIGAQRANIDNAWQAADGERGIYGLVREGFDDENAANAAATAALLQQAEMQVQQQMAGLDSDQARLNAEELLNQLEIQRQQAEAEAIRGQAEWALEAEDTMSRIEARRARTALAQQQLARRAGGGGGGAARPPRRGAVEEVQRLLEANFPAGRPGNEAAYDAFRYQLEELYGVPRPMGASPELGFRGTVQQTAAARGLESALSELENTLDSAVAEGRGTVGTGGVGPFDANLYPDWAASMLGDEEQLRVSQLRQSVIQQYQQMRSGVTVPERERRAYEAFLSATTLDQFRGALGALRSELGSRVGGEMRSSESAARSARADEEDADLLDEDE